MVIPSQTSTTEIDLPYNYERRWYQVEFERAFNSGKYTRFIKVWHRRAGKDLDDWNTAISYAAENPGIIVTYVFPTLKMGREIIWEGRTNTGREYLDYIPSRLLSKSPNNSRMTIVLVNGSIIRIGGSDSPDSLRGGNSGLFIFSEWAEQDPYTWDVVRPILVANHGKAIFNFTPKGRNHAWKMLQLAKSRDRWYIDIRNAKETGVFTDEELEEERQEIISKNGDDGIYRQEYMVSFDVVNQGSYYGKLLERIERDGHITDVPYEPQLPVRVVYDLGVGDSTAIWFYQMVGRDIRIIDYYENNGEGLSHYVKTMQDKEYVYDKNQMWAPHDITVREFGTGKSRLETAKNLGVDFRIVPKLSIEDGIEAVRNILPRCWFDKKKCERGLMALTDYAKEYDQKNKTFRNKPKHTWASHASDAFRYLAVSLQEVKEDDEVVSEQEDLFSDGYYI